MACEPIAYISLSNHLPIRLGWVPPANGGTGMTEREYLFRCEIPHYV
jgi:hypothetical protein